MIVPRGPKVAHKSTAIPDRSITVPKGYEYYSPTNVLVASGTPETYDIRKDGVSDIAYTNRPKGSLSTHSNFCLHKRSVSLYAGDPSQPQIINDLGHPGYYYKYWHGHALAKTGFLASVTAANAALGLTQGPQFLYNGAQAWINSAALKTRPDLTKLDLFNLATQSAGLLHENVEYLTKGLTSGFDLTGSYKALYFEWKRNASIVKNLGGQFLGYKFGLAPDIGDLNAASAGLLSFRKKLDAFKANFGKNLHTRVSILNDTVTKSGLLHSASQQNDVWSATLSSKVDAYLYYHVERIDSFGDIDETYRALLSTVGLELNPRVAWDAIPFSFVVDWFFNVGKVLERFKIPALELPISYTDSFLQFKQTVHIESRTAIDVGSAISTSSTWPGWTSDQSTFVRYPIFPDYSYLSGLGFRIPTGNQAILLVALGASLKG